MRKKEVAVVATRRWHDGSAVCVVFEDAAEKQFPRKMTVDGDNEARGKIELLQLCRALDVEPTKLRDLVGRRCLVEFDEEGKNLVAYWRIADARNI